MPERIKIFIASVLGADSRTPRWLAVPAALAVALLAWWYFVNAAEHGRTRNTELELNDQRVYLHNANAYAEPGGKFSMPRMRMPLYPWLLSFAVKEGRPDEEFFPVAQRFNIGLSLVCLVAMFVILLPWLGGWIGLCFCLVTGFQLFVLRSPYVQPEILLATLITISMAQMVRALHEPGWRHAVVAGLCLCLWFLTKASAQGALGLFGVVLGCKWLFAGRGARMPYFVTGVVVLAAYMLPMGSYLLESWRTFRNPFYNVQSKYYMWCEPPLRGLEMEDEKHFLQRLGIDRDLSVLENAPEDLPALKAYLTGIIGRSHYIDTLQTAPLQLPSAKRYLARHSFAEMEDRLAGGMRSMFKMAFTEYPALYLMLAVWASFAVWAMWRRWPETLRLVWDWRWEIVFVAAVLGVFAVLFGWFVPIRAGPRLIESITVAALFFCAAVTHGMLRGETAVIAGVRISMEKAIVVIFLAGWAVLTAWQVPADLAQGFFGG